MGNYLILIKNRHEAVRGGFGLFDRNDGKIEFLEFNFSESKDPNKALEEKLNELSNNYIIHKVFKGEEVLVSRGISVLGTQEEYDNNSTEVQESKND